MKKIQILFILTFFIFGKSAFAQFEACTIDTMCQNTEITYLLEAQYVIPLQDFSPNLGLLDFNIINSSSIEMNYQAFGFGVDSFQIVIGLLSGVPDTICYKIFIKQKIPLEFKCCKEFNGFSNVDLDIPFANVISSTILDAPINGEVTFNFIEATISYNSDSLWTGIDSFVVQSFPNLPGIAAPIIDCFIIHVTEGSTSISKITRQEFQIHISPNPTASIISYKIESAKEIELNHLSIFDSRGRKVLLEKNPQMSQELDLGDFARGIYYLQIQGENRIFTKKIVKQ